MSLFFGAGSAIALVSGVALLIPGGVLEPMWRLNPRARDAFTSLGLGSVALLAVVSVACGSSAVGLWRGARWGYRLALGLLVVNLLGDILNATLGAEPRAAIGVPIAGAIVAYLGSRRVRRFFTRAAS